MSKLTQAHYDLARHARWHLTEICAIEGVKRDGFEMDGAVRHYHRQDRYREINVTGRNQRILRGLADRVMEKAADMTGVRIHAKINGSMRHPNEKILSVSIWPDASQEGRSS